jgi:hypothetical protein
LTFSRGIDSLIRQQKLQKRGVAIFADAFSERVQRIEQMKRLCFEQVFKDLAKSMSVGPIQNGRGVSSDDKIHQQGNLRIG